MRKKARLSIRIAPADASLLTAASERVDVSVSELVREAALAEALRIIQTGTRGDRREGTVETAGRG